MIISISAMLKSYAVAVFSISLLSSPAGGRPALSAKQSADVFVLRASQKFECLATNSLGGEQMNASLAVSEGQIFIRTDKHLWCVGEQ